MSRGVILLYNKKLDYRYVPFNVNDLPYIKDKTLNELKIRFYELHNTAYNASQEMNYMLLRIEYLVDYLLKNYSEIGKKEIKQKLKEIEFYAKKPLSNVIKLYQLIGSDFNRK